MPKFWIDSDILIYAKNEPYRFDVVPGFWNGLEKCHESNKIGSSFMVYEEIVNLCGKTDELAVWAGKNIEFFSNPDRQVQLKYQQIAKYVKEHYEAKDAAVFLKGADAWVIAHASVDGGLVVTRETLSSDLCARVKIPNVCRAFKVPWIGLYKMFKELKISLILK